jgi:hypothetical protein
MRCSTIPKVLFGSVERIRRLGVGFGGVDPRVLFISSCPGFTGLTGALDRSDRCEPFVDLNLPMGVPEVDECGLAEIGNSKEETRGTQFRQVRAARCVIPYVMYVA